MHTHTHTYIYIYIYQRLFYAEDSAAATSSKPLSFSMACELLPTIWSSSKQLYSSSTL